MVVVKCEQVVKKNAEKNAKNALDAGLVSGQIIVKQRSHRRREWRAYTGVVSRPQTRRSGRIAVCWSKYYNGQNTTVVKILQLSNPAEQRLAASTESGAAPPWSSAGVKF